MIKSRPRKKRAPGVFADGAPPPRHVPDIEDDAVRQVIGAGFMRFFECMEIAEEELRNFAGPGRGSLNALFQREFFALSPDLYRHHCRELVTRMNEKRPLEPATRAEVLIGCMNTSLRAPLSQEWAAVYETLFSEIFPAKFAELGLARPISEKWKGQVEECIESESWRARRSRKIEES
jgi:hypothetical protein